MLNCNGCAWSHPETCKACKHEQEELERNSNQTKFNENALNIGLRSAMTTLAQYHIDNDNIGSN